MQEFPPNRLPSGRSVLQSLWGVGARVRQPRMVPPGAAGTVFAAIPRPADPKILVPVRSRRAAAATLRNYTSPSSGRGRARAHVLSAVGATGILRWWPRSLVVEAANGTGLVGHIGSVLEMDLLPGIHLGPPRANRKPVVHLMRKDGTVVGFAKVGVNDLTNERIVREVDALKQLARVSLKRLIVPDVLFSGSWDGLSYVVLSPVPTWPKGRIDKTIRDQSVRELGGAFGTQEWSLSQAPWWRQLLVALDDLSGAGATELSELARRLDEAKSEVVLRHGAVHGDWTPWNMAQAPGGTVVWDWERFRTQVPLGWDVLHYELELARTRGFSAAHAVRSLQPGAEGLVCRNGATPQSGDLLVATYLLHLGERFLRDRQAEVGEGRGSLKEWLVPELSRVVKGLEGHD